MAEAQPNDLVEELLHRIERLELNEAALQRELETLRETARNTEQILTENAIEATTIQPVNTIQQQIARDRDGTHIHIGDAVFILTRGVFTERWGTVTEIRTDINQIKILDREGISQRRAPRNVRVDQRDRQDNLRLVGAQQQARPPPN